jgi:L-2,4-diaminobutyric acid acetyltransferase
VSLPEAGSSYVANPELSVRTADVTDAAAIWRLVGACETLDNNSCYAYLLLCSDHADTCFVSYDDERLAGFVAGYVPPKREDVIFVWQIGIDPRYRGQGLARWLLSELVDRAADGVQYLEATVTPGNLASQRLFRSLADSHGWKLATSNHFDKHHFADPQHEQELLIRIGPFKERSTLA